MAKSKPLSLKICEQLEYRTLAWRVSHTSLTELTYHTLIKTTQNMILLDTLLRKGIDEGTYYEITDDLPEHGKSVEGFQVAKYATKIPGTDNTDGIVYFLKGDPQPYALVSTWDLGVFTQVFSALLYAKFQKRKAREAEPAVADPATWQKEDLDDDEDDDSNNDNEKT